MSAGGGTSSSDSRNRIDPAQKQYLKDLWGRAQQLTDLNSPEAAQQYSAQLAGMAMPMMGVGAGTFGDVATGQSLGQQQLAQNMTSESPWLQQQIGNLGQDIGRNLGENILPQLRSGGVAAGAPGGSRSQIAAGLAAQGAQRQFGQQATQLRAQDLQRQQQAAQMFTQNQMGGAQGMFPAAQAMYGMGMNPYMAQWLPLQQYSNLIGQPTIVGDSQSSSMNFAFGF